MNTNHVDKNSVKHFAYSFLAALYSTDFALGVGVGKEAADYLYYKHACAWDLVFDVAGTALGTAARMCLIRLIYGHWTYYWF